MVSARCKMIVCRHYQNTLLLLNHSRVLNKSPLLPQLLKAVVKAPSASHWTKYFWRAMPVRNKSNLEKWFSAFLIYSLTKCGLRCLWKSQLCSAKDKA